MLALFKALVMSRHGYGCQLWSPYLIKHINIVEKVKSYFTRFISGMAGLSYTERLTVLKLYSLQRRRERYIIIYVWKILEGLVPNLFPPYVLKHWIVEGGPVYHVTHKCWTIGNIGV